MAGWKVCWNSREDGCPEMSHGSVPDDTSNIGEQLQKCPPVAWGLYGGSWNENDKVPVHF